MHVQDMNSWMQLQGLHGGSGVSAKAASELCNQEYISSGSAKWCAVTLTQ
jgi:hypothetical protein